MNKVICTDCSQKDSCIRQGWLYNDFECTAYEKKAKQMPYKILIWSLLTVFGPIVLAGIIFGLMELMYWIL